MAAHPEPTPVGGFRRDRATWLAYLLLAWFAYLQAAPGLVLPHLRDEFRLGYAAGGLHVAGFAAGSTLAGVAFPRLEGRLGRGTLLWTAAATLSAGTIGLTTGRAAVVTVASVVVMGVGGGLVLAGVQASLVDHHGPRSAVALTEANVAASGAYVLLIGALSLAAALHVSWRIALLASLVLPAVLWSRRGSASSARPTAVEASERLPGVFWVATGMLVCAVAAEWCITAWGASFVREAAGVSSDEAVTVMAGYFGGVLVGRVLGSRLARRTDPAHLLAIALAVAAIGFAVLRPATAPSQALLGLALLGVGLGNLFPMAISVTVALVPGRTAQANGSAVAATSLAVLVAPLVVGGLADRTSLATALGVVPIVIVLAAAGLVLVQRARKRAGPGMS